MYDRPTAPRLSAALAVLLLFLVGASSLNDTESSSAGCLGFRRGAESRHP